LTGESISSTVCIHLVTVDTVTCTLSSVKSISSTQSMKETCRRLRRAADAHAVEAIRVHTSDTFLRPRRCLECVYAYFITSTSTTTLWRILEALSRQIIMLALRMRDCIFSKPTTRSKMFIKSP